MKVAALDLGTNSFLCLIAEVENGQVTKVYQDLMKVVRLGQDVNRSKSFQPGAIARAHDCLLEFSKQIQIEKPDRVLAMATSAARDVTNSDELFKIGRETQIPIEIIPGDREAEITFMGGTSHLPPDGKKRIVIDVGGGSTEYILGKNHAVEVSESLNIGCVRMTESLITAQPISRVELAKLAATIDSAIGPITKKIKAHPVDQVIAVAGTPSAIAAAEIGHFTPEKVDGFVLTQANLKSWTEEFSSLSIEERVKKYGLEKGRADVIAVGAMILWRSLVALEAISLTVSVKGVRYGIALELARKKI